MKVIMTDSEKKFEEYRNSLWQELRRLTSYVRIYIRINQRSGDRLDEINIAPHFFFHIQDALLNSIILWVDKLFDNKSERSLENFLKFVENHRNLFAYEERNRRQEYSSDRNWTVEDITFEVIKSDSQKLRDIKSLPSFKFVRDKFTAHFDKQYFFNKAQIPHKAQISWPDDFDECIALGREILNRYSIAYDGQDFEINDSEAHDIDNLLDSLHHYRICTQQKLR